MSDISHVKLEIEETPDKNKKILEIVGSPNSKYIATLDQDSNINLYSIDNQGKLLKNIKTNHINNICTKGKGERLFAISNNKCVSIGLDRDKPYNFKIFDFENEKEVLFRFPDWQKEIDFLSFIANGDIIIVNTKYYRAYVFSNKNNISWDCKSMIELKYFKKIYITLKGKLIIFNDTIYEITMWDVEKLSIKTRILIDWDFTPESIEISDDEELLVVCARNVKTKKTCLYIFSTETGINLSFFTTKDAIDRFHLIASRKGERLLYISDDPYNLNHQYNLMDPYNLKNPIDAGVLFERDKIPIRDPYIILSDEISDKIVYTIDGRVLIEELVPNNWVKYLRKELNDTNRITTLSKKTIDIIAEIINKLTDDYNVNRKEFEGESLKWGLELDDKSVRITAIDYNHRKMEWNPDDKKKHLDILPSFYPNGKDFILCCEILENDDLIMITRIGVIIWTYRRFEIKMHYYWNYWNDRLEQFEFEMIKFKNFFKDWTPGRILPASNYETIYKNLDVKFGEEEIQLFETFLKDNILDEFYLNCYGKILMETFIKLKDDKWIRYLGGSCMDKFVQDNNHLIPKISLLSIIFENFNRLSENHPSFLKSVLSVVGFVVPSNIVITNSFSSHFSSYGKYHHLSKTSFLDILFSILWIRWVSFQASFQKFHESYLFQCFYECHIIKLREHIIDIENNKWLGYKKPYISNNLKEVILIPEEQPSLTQIEESIRELKNSIKELKESTKELKESTKEPSLARIENDIKELKDQLKS
ncbi:21449_t:CDS:2 [Cetraspora pellucida]|uniref:21449_t:CDS:1 n=1 Tax=Cetraspora pellucida TaxID=1433469 RepID=A0A9N9BSN1_9GLOM|nr:21449_t:CDS:2 [Cetraspora pellucida]